jgi:undecaprenyl pyrophosphate synthase
MPSASSTPPTPHHANTKWASPLHSTPGWVRKNKDQSATHHNPLAVRETLLDWIYVELFQHFTLYEYSNKNSRKTFKQTFEVNV